MTDRLLAAWQFLSLGWQMFVIAYGLAGLTGFVALIVWIWRDTRRVAAFRRWRGTWLDRAPPDTIMRSRR